MVYFWKKNGQVYRHAAETKAAAMEAARQMDGLSGQPEAEASDEDFEAGGCLARVIGGKIVVGKTGAEKQSEQNAARVRALKRLLADTDYIAVKIAEGAATASDYAAKLAERQAWRAEIQQLESA
jgi:antirestriction protein ArdC